MKMSWEEPCKQEEKLLQTPCCRGSLKKHAPTEVVGQEIRLADEGQDLEEFEFDFMCGSSIRSIFSRKET